MVIVKLQCTYVYGKQFAGRNLGLWCTLFLIFVIRIGINNFDVVQLIIKC